jgi:transcriptional regulator with XRE-family HTH domain
MARAKTELMERARELRRAGKTYDEITAELGVSKSSVSLWVRDLPKPGRSPRTTAEASAAANRGWAPVLRARAVERQQTKLTAAREIGALTDREL